MNMQNNIPCTTLTPQILMFMCNYEWALSTIEDNIDKLNLNAWRILKKQSWAECIFIKYSNAVPANI